MLNVLIFFDAHAVLFTVRISGAFPYETRPVNGTALILVTKRKQKKIELVVRPGQRLDRVLR